MDRTSTATAAPAPQKRPQRVQAVLEVQAKTRISPRLLRIRLGGEQFGLLRRNEHTDSYVKLLLADPSSGLTPPYDLDAIRESAPEKLPVRRTYTVRRWHDAEQALDLDVVLHAEEDADGGTRIAGVAARWADEALPGDRIALSGAGGAYTPDPDAARHLLLGDHAALPAVAAALESLPAHATGTALVHLDHADDALDIPHPAGVELRWVVGEREQLLSEAATLDLSDVSGLQVFCHAERGLTKSLRRLLVSERGVPKEQLSISAYWALGRVEDQFQAETREPIGAIDS